MKIEGIYTPLVLCNFNYLFINAYCILKEITTVNTCSTGFAWLFIRKLKIK
jgi:hypothetical protein